jgi:hypothetical protein
MTKIERGYRNEKALRIGAIVGRITERLRIATVKTSRGKQRGGSGENGGEQRESPKTVLLFKVGQ